MTVDAPALACRPLVAGLIAVIAAMAASCARTVAVEGSSPAPLVHTLPLSIGIFYDTGFREASHRVERPRQRTFVVKFGAANVEQFDNVFRSLFERAVPLEQMPAEGSSIPNVDAIIEPRIEEYAALTPDDSGQQFYAASIKYRIHLFSPDGTLIASWPVNAYGKSQWRAFRDKRVLREASMLAIRDAAASLALGFADQQQVRTWLRSKGVRRAQGN
ncbi:MAG: hypothetical protein ACREVN_05430 [Gammaproteobacteria bacterium]